MSSGTKCIVGSGTKWTVGSGTKWVVGPSGQWVVALTGVSGSSDMIGKQPFLLSVYLSHKVHA